MHASSNVYHIYVPRNTKWAAKLASFILFGQGQDRNVASVTREGQAYVRDGIDGESAGRVRYVCAAHRSVRELGSRHALLLR